HRLFAQGRQLLRHRRIRLPRAGGAERARPVLLRRLLQRARVEPEAAKREGGRAPPRALQGREPVELRRGRRGRALPRLAERHDLPARALAGPAVSDLRALLTEGGVRERLERLVQRRELAGDPEEVLARVEL